MSVFKQNPFLAGFGVVMLVGVAGLGYLGYSASDENAAARKKYDDARGKLKGLQGSQLYPNEANLKKVQALKLEQKGKVDGLQKDLSALKIKVDDITSAGFQDKLKETVNALNTRGTEAKVKFPGNEREKEIYYFGFDAYKSTQPKPEAAGPLYRELKAIESVVGMILDARYADIQELVRPEIREEKDAKPVPGKPGKGEAATGRALIERQSFTIRFVTSPDNFQTIFNKIVGNKEQLYVIRSVAVHNTVLEPPSKTPGGSGAGGNPAPPPTPVPPAPASPGTPPVPPTPPTPAAPGATPPAAAPAEAPVQVDTGKKEFIFGKELVEASFQIDVVDVQQPAAPADKPAKPAAKK